MEQQLYQTLDLTNGGKVLDGGAGNGDVAIFMAKKGLSIQGIDLLQIHVNRAQENFNRNGIQASVEQGRYERLRLKNNSFDGAYTMETLVHLSDPDKAMREFYRVLRLGGVIVLVEYEHDIDESKPAALAVLSKINTYTHMPAFQQFTSLGGRISLRKRRHVPIASGARCRFRSTHDLHLSRSILLECQQHDRTCRSSLRTPQLFLFWSAEVSTHRNILGSARMHRSQDRCSGKARPFLLHGRPRRRFWVYSPVRL